MFYALKRVLLVTALVCMGTPAYAQNAGLMKIGETSQGSIFLNLPTVLQDNLSPKVRQKTRYGASAVLEATAWAIIEHRKPKIQGTMTVWSTKTQYDFDCPGDRARVHAVIAMSGHMGTGKMLASDAKPKEWKQVDPNSTDAKLLGTTCGKDASVFMDFLGQMAQAETERKMSSQPKRTGIQQISNSDDEGRTAFVDMSTIHRTGDKASAILIMDMSKQPKFHSTTSTMEFRCASKQYRSTSMSIYKDYKANGLMMTTKDPKNLQPWQQVRGPSIAQTMFNLGCGIAVDFDEFDFYDVAFSKEQAESQEAEAREQVERTKREEAAAAANPLRRLTPEEIKAGEVRYKD